MLNGSDAVNCDNCGKELNNEIIAYCEKCEEIYCMSCCKGHSHGLSFRRYENNVCSTIDIGISGMGYIDVHEKLYCDYEEILKNSKCKHVENKIKQGQPIFSCEDGMIRCSECFYDSGMQTIRPLIKLNHDNKLIWLIPSSFDPFNLNLQFKCDSQGIKGEQINANIKIENKKKNPIKDVNIAVYAFAADPCPSNMAYGKYTEDLYPYYLIIKHLHIDSINSHNVLDMDFKLKIPEDGEIKINQFDELYIVDESENIYCNNGFLDVPDNLMFYACFSYKTYSDYVFISYIETYVVNMY